MNRFMITRRQAVMLFLICTVSSKLQKLPCLLACELQNDLWQVLLLGAFVDVIFFAITILINRLCPNLTVNDMLKKTFGAPIAFIVSTLLLFYFVCTALMPYQAVRDVFASNLFDKLSWQIFSLFLLFAVGYLAYSGMRTLGRSAELYFWIIFASVIMLITLGLISAPLSNILPAFTSSFDRVLRCTTKHSIWFGDYLIFYVLIGRIKPGDSGLKWYDILYYVGAIGLYCAAYISFYSLYTVLFSTQTSLLTSISSFSLLNLDIGRADWFLVLFSQLASVLSCTTYVYCATDSLNNITGKKNYVFCLLICLAAVYLSDILGFSNLSAGINTFVLVTKWPALIIQTAVPIICLISAILVKNRSKSSKNLVKRPSKTKKVKVGELC